MNRHDGPPDDSHEPEVPEPTYAERVRTLLYLRPWGALATLSRKLPGHPFGSVMPYALDAGGRPLFLISALATHTQNLRADPRASLLVTEAAEGGDPLAVGRATLMGDATPVSAAEVGEVSAAYLARHTNAAYWVDVAGYAAARPDPLADAAAGILDHVNRDHADALLTLAHALARVGADEATMVSVDRLGFKLRLRSGQRLSSARLPFPREVRSADECRAALIEMLRGARARPSPQPSP